MNAPNKSGLGYRMAACAIALGISAWSANAQRSPSIGVLPGTARVCPGGDITAKYVERFPDGTQANLSPSDVRQIRRSESETATMGRDGSWRTSPDPLRSMISGFRLSVSLARDTSVRGDTVVAPSYDCLRADVRLTPSSRVADGTAYVRLGTFATPFYDSVVVAVIELDTRAMGITVLSPGEMRSGAIKVSAPGNNGAPGHAGRPGSDGIDCGNGDDGEDGQPGGPGSPGREVTIITQQGAAWLASLVAVSNPGGRGGAGGAPGRGGYARAGASSTSGRGSTSTACRPRSGRSGRPGAPGPDGSPGEPPKVTSVLAQLLWPGSPIWSDSSAKRALEELMKYDQKR